MQYDSHILGSSTLDLQIGFSGEGATEFRRLLETGREESG